eukprot:s2840_g1.t1
MRCHVRLIESSSAPLKRQRASAGLAAVVLGCFALGSVFVLPTLSGRETGPVTARAAVTQDKRLNARSAFHNQVLEGKVKSYNQQKGFGFIECDAVKQQYKRDVFLHKQQAEGLQAGDCVNFEVELSLCL